MHQTATRTRTATRPHGLIPAIPRASGTPAHGARLAAAAEELRRMRYYRDLLAQGYQYALAPDPETPTLRARRLELGIDHPELDTVPFWSRRGPDGTVAIPFLEYVLRHTLYSLQRYLRLLRPGEPTRPLVPTDRAIGLILAWDGVGKPIGPGIPRLEERMLPESLVRQVCGPGGALERIVSQCDHLLAREERRNPIATHA